MKLEEFFKALNMEIKKECEHEWVKGSFIVTYCKKCGIDQSKIMKDKIKE